MIWVQYHFCVSISAFESAKQDHTNVLEDLNKKPEVVPTTLPQIPKKPQDLMVTTFDLSEDSSSSTSSDGKGNLAITFLFQDEI